MCRSHHGRVFYPVAMSLEYILCILTPQCLVRCSPQIPTDARPVSTTRGQALMPEPGSRLTPQWSPAAARCRLEPDFGSGAVVEWCSHRNLINWRSGILFFSRGPSRALHRVLSPCRLRQPSQDEVRLRKIAPRAEVIPPGAQLSEGLASRTAPPLISPVP